MASEEDMPDLQPQIITEKKKTKTSTRSCSPQKTVLVSMEDSSSPATTPKTDKSTRSKTCSEKHSQLVKRSSSRIAADKNTGTSDKTAQSDKISVNASSKLAKSKDVGKKSSHSPSAMDRMEKNMLLMQSQVGSLSASVNKLLADRDVARAWQPQPSYTIPRVAPSCTVSRAPPSDEEEEEGEWVEDSDDEGQFVSRPPTGVDPFALDDSDEDVQIVDDDYTAGIVEELGVMFKLESKRGPDMDVDLLKRLVEMFTKPLPDKEVDILLSQFKSPLNCKLLLDTEKTNEEVKIHIPGPIRKIDTRLQRVQLCVLKGLIEQIELLQEVKKNKGSFAKKVAASIKTQFALAVTEYEELSTQRKYLLRPYIDDRYHAICTRPDDYDPMKQVFLFGDKLEEKVTAMAALHSVSQKLGKKKKEDNRYYPYPKRGGRGFLGRGRGKSQRGTGYSNRKGKGGRFRRQNQRYQQFQGYQHFAQFPSQPQFQMPQMMPALPPPNTQQ